MFKFELKQDILVWMRFLSFLLTTFYLFLLPNLVAFVLLPFGVFLPAFAVFTGIYLVSIFAPGIVCVVILGGKRVNLESSQVGSEMRKVLRGKMTYPYLYTCNTELYGIQDLVWGRYRDYYLVNERFFDLNTAELLEKINQILKKSNSKSFFYDSSLKALNLILLSILRWKYRLLKRIFRSSEVAFAIIMLIYFVYLPFFYLSESLLNEDPDIFSIEKIGRIDKTLFNIENKVIN